MSLFFLARLFYLEKEFLRNCAKMGLTYAYFFDKINKMLNLDDKKSAYLITDRVTRRYFSLTDVAEGFLLLSEKPVYFTDSRYFFAAKDKIKNGIESKLYGGLESIAAEIKAQGIKTLYVDYDRTTMTEYERYKSFGTEIKDGSKALKQCRVVKTAEELDSIRRACDIIQNAYHSIISLAKEGMTEIELQDLLENKCKELGAEGMSFETIVAFGANSAIPHHVTGNTRLEKNMPVLIDCGCVVNGYCSDYTRTAFFGEPSDKFLDVYESVRIANEKVENEVVADISLKAADAIARDYLFERGYGELFTHSLGHGVGLEIHESPMLSPKSEGILPVGATFTVEPGVYINGEFGVRIEDTVLMTENGAERLFSDDKNLIIL